MAESQEEVERASYYDASLQAWFATQLERDRSLLTLSAGAVGLLITLLTTVGPSSHLELVLAVLAGVAFIAAVFVVLAIFSLNATFLEALRRGERIGQSALRLLDRLAVGSFSAGVMLFAAVGVMHGTFLLQERESKMTEPVQKVVIPDVTRSFSSLPNMAPQQTAPSATTTPATPPQPAAGTQPATPEK